jgi:ABC-2 type transport system ATP-binding protein
MSIEVKQLTKIYGEQHAVNEISFSVSAGEVLGFLGPNGAGKSTTMKILTGFIPQTSGSASVCGFDVEKNSLEVRRRTGYLPEHNPLYKDMYVREYLEFVARLFSISGRKARIAQMIERTGLGPEQHKKIRQLSKGYRQRVGLAQAMLNDPDVLVLDEPTSGLDPNQLADIRKLIRELGKEKTVILSTHIMQEVKAICDRVIIINNGELVANDSTANLEQMGSEQVLFTVQFKEETSAATLRTIKGVDKAVQVGTSWQLSCNTEEGVQEAVFRFAVDNGLTLLSSNMEKRNLEDVFRDLTRSKEVKS